LSLDFSSNDLMGWDGESGEERGIKLRENIWNKTKV
jgi:hypothetical protein